MSDRKAIYITGGGSGIGRAVALHFAERGWFVGLGDIDKTGLHETAELSGNGFVYTHLHDVRDRTAWDEALEAFSVATGGRIEVQPGAVNGIPGRADLSLDLRAATDEARDAMWARMERRLEEMCEARGLRFEAQERHRAPAAPCAPWLTAAVVADAA